MLYAWFAAMHTRVDAALISDKGEDFMLDAVHKMRLRIRAIENLANCFDPRSELSAINRTAADASTGISPELERILSDCLRYNRTTGGLFDITTASDDYCAATINEIILPCNGTISFRRRGLRINLSGFLKGYALEQIRPLLHRAGITDALISMGNSSVMALGGMESGKGWTIGFDGKTTDAVTTLFDECLTTSGNDSETRRHIINPANGKLIEGCRTVSVLNHNAAEGEVLSTSLFIDNKRTFPDFGKYRLIDSHTP